MVRAVKKTQTYTRIVDAGLALFNELGERNVSTNHIAQHLGISPGNLYYHFANKEEIIVQIFKRYSSELLAYLTDAELPASVKEAVGYLGGVYDIMWKYRFLFNDINSLMLRSAEFLVEHNQFTGERVSPLLIELLTRMQNAGILEIDDTGKHDLSVNMWLVTKYWFDFDRSMIGQGSYGSDIIPRGIRRTLSLVRPYLKEPHLQEFDEMMHGIPML